MKTNHKDSEVTLECLKCSHKFDTKLNLARHTELKHEPENDIGFYCVYFKRKFKLQANYKVLVVVLTTKSVFLALAFRSAKNVMASSVEVAVLLYIILNLKMC